MLNSIIKEYQYIQNDIDEILDCFDFEKVQKVMAFLDWKWHDTGVPEVYELRKFARKQIRYAVENVIRTGESELGTECGGFYVQVYNKTKEDPTIRICLRFSLTSWDNFE